jgi:predicted aconitase
MIIAMANVYGAERLIDVSRSHIDGCICTGEAAVRFADKLRKWGARVVIPTTLNAISVDRDRWQSQRVDRHFAQAAEQLADAYVEMGAQPSYTCAPYLLESRPREGEQIAWAESNAVVYANSVLGARTMKYPDFLDVCIAITGRAPASGCHLDENRRATININVVDARQVDDTYFCLLGYHVGRLSGRRIPLISGLENCKVTNDDLKNFGAAFATTSSAPMYHIAGHTLEARDPARLPISDSMEVCNVTPTDLFAIWREFNGEASSTRVIDLISIGSPHASLSEIGNMAQLCADRTRHPEVEVIVTCSRDTLAGATEAGYVSQLQNFGMKFITDTCWCMIGEPIINPEIRQILTNSAKYAHYGPGLSGRRVLLGSLEQCMEAACQKEYVLSEPPISR